MDSCTLSLLLGDPRCFSLQWGNETRPARSSETSKTQDCPGRGCDDTASPLPPTAAWLALPPALSSFFFLLHFLPPSFTRLFSPASSQRTVPFSKWPLSKQMLLSALTRMNLSTCRRLSGKGSDEDSRPGPKIKSALCRRRLCGQRSGSVPATHFRRRCCRHWH